MTSWSCHRLRADLVDFADGKLDEPRRARLEHHVASCSECADMVLELREMPGQLRRLASADPPAEFWKDQRASILAAIGDPQSFVRREPPLPSRRGAWRMPLALAASLAITVIMSRWWTIPATTSSPVPAAATRPMEVASAERPIEATFMSADEATLSNDVLYLEDTSLLSLAEQLDEDSGGTTADSLI